MIVDSYGKPVKAEDFQKCPKCGADKKERGPSAGFGNPYTMCKQCGYEFKEIPWQPVIP